MPKTPCQEAPTPRTAMPLADRDPLGAAEARVSELERQLDAARRDCADDARDRRYWTSQTNRRPSS
eukprot:2996721-Prymnesium_polylepis.2